MTLFITRYFLKEISAWILFTPIAFIFILLIGAFSGAPITFILITTFFSSAVVFSKYHEKRKDYKKMFALFPINSRIMLHADISFLGWISVCYISYTLAVSLTLKSLVEKQWASITVGQFCMIIGCSILLIGISLILIWWNFPPSTLVIVILIINMFSIWDFLQLPSFQKNLLFLIGSLFILLVIYIFIRIKQKRRNIT